MTRPTVNPATAVDCLDEVIDYAMTVDTNAVSAQQIVDDVLALSAGEVTSNLRGGVSR